MRESEGEEREREQYTSYHVADTTPHYFCVSRVGIQFHSPIAIQVNTLWVFYCLYCVGGYFEGELVSWVGQGGLIIGCKCVREKRGN